MENGFINLSTIKNQSGYQINVSLATDTHGTGPGLQYHFHHTTTIGINSEANLHGAPWLVGDLFQPCIIQISPATSGNNQPSSAIMALSFSQDAGETYFYAQILDAPRMIGQTGGDPDNIIPVVGYDDPVEGQSNQGILVIGTIDFDEEIGTIAIS